MSKQLGVGGRGEQFHGVKIRDMRVRLRVDGGGIKHLKSI